MTNYEIANKANYISRIILARRRKILYFGSTYAILIVFYILKKKYRLLKSIETIII
jgi:hypothetical protein